MGIGTSIFLFAVGAILRYAVTVTTKGVNLHVVGDILMLVGIVGFILSLVFWSSWGGFGGYGRGRTTVVDGGGYGRRRRTVIEERDSEY
ncbi:MAG: hypothetical protein QOK39_1000 [Acidimicrobiaceae bacterium]|jgi:hypothetical protein|nr:hypothetical protein [Acidimicrobiaceae bacterium]